MYTHNDKSSSIKKHRIVCCVGLIQPQLEHFWAIVVLHDTFLAWFLLLFFLMQEQQIRYLRNIELLVSLWSERDSSHGLSCILSVACHN